MKKRIKIVALVVLIALLISFLLWVYLPACGPRLHVDGEGNLIYTGARYNYKDRIKLLYYRGFYRIDRREENKIGTDAYYHFYRSTIWVSNLDTEANIIYTSTNMYLKEGFSLPDPYTSPVASFSIYGYAIRPGERHPNATDRYIFLETDSSQKTFTLGDILGEQVEITPQKNDELYLSLAKHPYLLMSLYICMENERVYIGVPGEDGTIYYQVKEEYQELFRYERRNDIPDDGGISPHFYAEFYN